MHSRALGNILRIGRCCKLYRRRALKDTDLHPALHLLLSQICRHPGLAQEELIGSLYLDKTTVTHQLSKLEELGYIRRLADPADGRCRHVYPSEKGEKIYPRVHEAFSDFTEGLLDGFSAEEREALDALTERLMRNAARMAAGEKGAEP